MPIFAPPHEDCEACRRGWRPVNDGADLVGLTAGEALERIDPPARPHSLLGRLWVRVHQAWCSHPAATAVRVPASIRPVFRRHCARCDKRWSEVG